MTIAVMRGLIAGPYLEFFEQGSNADIVSHISGWGWGRDDTYKSVIVTLSDLQRGNCPPPHTHTHTHALGTALNCASDTILEKSRTNNRKHARFYLTYSILH